MDKMINLDRHYMLNVIGKVDELSENVKSINRSKPKANKKIKLHSRYS